MPYLIAASLSLQLISAKLALASTVPLEAPKLTQEASLPPIGQYVIQQALKHNLDPEKIKKILDCESGMNPKAYNEDNGAQARGLWQITRQYHPEVTDEQAYDPYWATDWSLDRINDGFKSEWSCVKLKCGGESLRP